MTELEEALREGRENLLESIARSEANIIDKLPQIREANEAYREMAKGVLALNGAGVAGATTLLTVSDFPKGPVGLAASAYLISLCFTLAATALEIGRPFLQLYLARTSLEHSRSTLENLSLPVSMEQTFALEDIRLAGERKMLIGRPWGWAVQHAPWLTCIGAVGFVWATVTLIATGWAFTR